MKFNEQVKYVFISAWYRLVPHPQPWIISSISLSSYHKCIHANCPYLIVTIPILTETRSKKESDFTMCPYFGKHLSILTLF